MKKNKYLLFLEISVIIILAVYFYLILARYGVSWDNISHYFNTLTMLSKSKYYEILRAPLIQLILIPGTALNVSLYEDILSVQIFLIIFFLFSLKMLSKSLKVNKISIFLLALSPFVISFMFVLNITDIFGMSIAILAFAYYYQKKYFKSSIIFGLAFLAKFTNLLFLPLMPLLFKGKYRILGVLLALLIDLPWFGYNYLLYHNPVYGFELSNLVFSGQHVFNLSSIAAALNSLLQILWPIFIVIGILIYLRKIRGYNFHNLFKSISRDEIYLLIFAIFEFIYIGSAQNYITWLLYPLYIALIIIGIKILSRIELPSIHAIKINITLALIVFLILSILIYYNLNPNNKISNWHLWFSKNPNYSAAINKSKDLGCNALYSNAWPYLMIYNPTVNSFYLSSTKNSIATDSCILFFNTSNVGVPVNLSKFNFTILNKNLNYSIFKNN